MRYGWTLKATDWHKLAEITSGTTWGHTALDSLYRDTVPDEPGVYAICARAGTATDGLLCCLYDAVYIGKAELSLRRRFLEHCTKPKAELAQAAECFRLPMDFWFTEADADIVAELESRLIDCLGPVANCIRGRIPAKLGTPQPA